MRLISTVFIFLTVLIFTITPAEAHFRGQPFVKINGESTKIYTQNEFASIGDISVPSDIAPGVYVPNEEIKFEIDVSVLPFPEEVTKKAKYTWDFGDGTKVEGDKVSHTYTKAGPYEINVEINYGDLSSFGFGDPSAIPPAYQLVLMNVLPDADYKVPTPSILINGQDIKNYQRKINGALLPSSAAFLELYDHIGGFRIAKKFTFDASKSSGTAKIKEYMWDFDDTDSIARSAKVGHSFTNGYYLNIVALRITDENGFYSDVFFDIGNKDMDERKDGEEKDESPIIGSRLIYMAAIGGLIGLGTIGLVVWNLMSKKKYRKNEEGKN